MTDRFRVVPAAYVFLLRPGPDGDEVLLQLRQNTGYMDDHWAAAAAGHVERGETAYDAARREASEEIGVDGLALEFVTSMQRTQHADAIDERIDFFFTARAWSGEPRIIEPAKCAALDWFALSALARSGGPPRADGADATGGGASGVLHLRVRLNPSEGGDAMANDLGDPPRPRIEPAEPAPGGVDSIDEELYDTDPVVPDLASALHPRPVRPRTRRRGRGHR